MKLYRYFLLIFLVFVFDTSFLYADEISTTNNGEIIEETENTDSEEIKKQKEELKKISKDLIEDMREKINLIDEEIDELRKTEEYLAYPTIRLNIDTPLFGIKSIVNQKLKITKDVCATDVAKGYSVRSIVKNKTIKIPDVKVGKLVVSTKDIGIDSSHTVSEYNVLVLKLVNYVEKIDSVYEFLETHTNKMFKEYISKEKKENINDLNTRLVEINKKLIAKDADLLKLYFNSYSKYSTLNEKYLELNNTQNSLLEESSNVLVENAKLTELQKNLLSLESDMIDYLNDIDTIMETEQLDLNKIYINLYNDMNNRLNKVLEYEKASKQTIEIKNNEIKEDNVGTTENKEDDKDGNKEDENSLATVEEKTIYEVYSKKNIENLEYKIKELEKKLVELEIEYKETEKIQKENIDKSKEDEKNTEEVLEKKEELKSEEKENYINQAIDIYRGFLKIEYNFYLDNVNGLLKDTNSKIIDLAKYTDLDVIADIKYIYISLPKNLEEYLDNYNYDSMIELNILISKFKDELVTLNEKNIKVMELYEKMNVESKINDD